MTADDTVTAKLAEWEALVEGATEGPWVQNGTNGVHTPNGRCIALTYMALPGVRDQRTPDAEFIAAAPTIVPALLGFVREVLTLIDEDHCPGGCEHDAIDAEVLGDRIKRALMEQIGGEG